MGGMRVLVACETSGKVRRAFADLGHDAWSCDLLPCDDRSNKHIVGDARSLLNDGWDLLMVAHPPCTRLCNSGVRWLHEPPKPGTDEHKAWSFIHRAPPSATRWKTRSETFEGVARAMALRWGHPGSTNIENVTHWRQRKLRLNATWPGS